MYDYMTIFGHISGYSLSISIRLSCVFPLDQLGHESRCVGDNFKIGGILAGFE